MAPTRKTKIRNVALALFAGLIAGGGTIASFAQHTAHPAARVSVRPFEDSSQGFDILRRMLQSDASMPLEGDQTTLLYRNGRPIESTQHVLRDGSRGLRITYSAPPRMAQTIIIDDGVTLYQYNGLRNALDESASKLARRAKMYPAIMKAHADRILSVAVLDTDVVAGRSCTVIQVERKRDPGPIRTFWVDDATGVQLKVQVQERSGVLRSVTQYTAITFNVQIPAGAFTPPATRPGTQVHLQSPANPQSQIPSAQVQAGFPLLQPSHLPTGYLFQNAEVTRSVDGGNMVHSRYSNGVNTLSIFQTPVGRGRDSVVSFPQSGVATMVKSGHRVIVIANLPNDQLSDVITSMR